MRPKATTLTPQELEIMKIIWRLEAAPVRGVYEEIRKERPIAYTTVMTMMKILEQKGYLKKTEHERAFIYSAAQPRDHVVTGMVAEFVERVFNGAAQPLLVNLVENRKLTAKDVAEIQKLLKAVKPK